MKFYHELSREEQDAIISELEEIQQEALEDSKVFEARLSKFWEEKREKIYLDYPIEFTWQDTYDDPNYDDYFGFDKEWLNGKLIELSKDFMYQQWEDGEEKEPDCPGSQNERDFYR